MVELANKYDIQGTDFPETCALKNMFLVCVLTTGKHRDVLQIHRSMNSGTAVHGYEDQLNERRRIITHIYI